MVVSLQHSIVEGSGGNDVEVTAAGGNASLARDYFKGVPSGYRGVKNDAPPTGVCNPSGASAAPAAGCVNASNSYWDDPSGPSTPDVTDKTSPDYNAGLGTPVSAGVTFKPILTTNDLSGGIVLTVRATSDPSACPSVPGSESPLSLRCAIAQANADLSGDSIVFNISSSGNSSCASGVCTIALASALPALTAGTTSIDGANGTSVAGVRIDGASPSVGYANGLDVQGSNDAVKNLVITGFQYTSGDSVAAGGRGIVLAGNNETVTGDVLGNNKDSGLYLSNSNNDTISYNHIGVAADGVTAQGNGFSGIDSLNNSSNNTITSNVIGANYDAGIHLWNGSHNIIQSNTIGLGVAGNGNSDGITIEDGGNDNSILGNTISSNKYDGAVIYGGSGNVFSRNIIESNGGSGINYAGASDSTTVRGAIDTNTIAQNTGLGVLVGSSASSNVHVVITKNSMFYNGAHGIVLNGQDPGACASGPVPGKPNDYTPCPVITTATTATVTGTVGSLGAPCAGCTVEVYTTDGSSDTNGEGKVFIGFAITDSMGAWSLDVRGQGLRAGSDKLTATSTSTSAAAPSGETSEFAANVTVQAAPAAAGTPNASVQPAGPIDFGRVISGTVSATQLVMVTNNGDANSTLTVSGVSVDDAVRFGQTNTCTTPLGQGASCAINVSFMPSARGPVGTTLRIADNSGGIPVTQTVALTGTGIAPRPA